ncbi:hypothetical protein AXG93_2018s1560 [Marchantia polymorpha subsp. ruderalis]|uniref:Intraflagellar transport protein 46 homolog n=1 Tax=Marchantia polymorpha subsp. ruderalis TaxID=1480154 RepID=A0A176WD47_MARPO|nr:hypothetical protein AXG93_2018s1560 [Marchantia polymorpha subsp. ruderalis]
MNCCSAGYDASGDRVMSRRSGQQATTADIFGRPPSPYHSAVNDEIRGLFDYIGAYKVQEVEISTTLKPFIPEYILAVGAIDEFIKVPRPDNQPDYLGLKVLAVNNSSPAQDPNDEALVLSWTVGRQHIEMVLDESGTKQSDPAVLTLQLRAASNQTDLLQLEISSVEYAEKNPRKLDAWINSIKDLHQSKPPPTVIYSKPMPDVEKLMQCSQVGSQNGDTSLFPYWLTSLQGISWAIHRKSIEASTSTFTAVARCENLPQSRNVSGHSDGLAHQEWPASIENELAEIQLPTAKLDVDLATFVDICCSVLDIPV